MVWKTLVAQQRTNAQLNSHTDMAGYRMVRGERFTHKPTVNLLCSRVLFTPFQTSYSTGNQSFWRRL